MTVDFKRFQWKGWLLLAVVVVGVALGVVRALSKRAAQQQLASESAAALQRPPVFELSDADLVRVRDAELTQEVAVSGSLRAVTTAVLKARVAGELQGLRKREGDAVREGEVLARVDSTEAQARVRQADQQAQAALAQVQIVRRNADNNQALVGQGFISATALDTATANLAAAEANHRAAVAALDIARKSLADTNIYSPINGQVSARLMQEGERVAVDGRVLEVVDLSAFEVEAALAPADAALVRTGQPVSLRVEGLQAPVPGKVVRINPSVQAGSRSVLVYLQAQAVPGMRQGLFVQGQIRVGSLQGLVVPTSAVRNDKPQPYLQTVQDGQVKHWPLQTTGQGSLGNESMLALQGLPAGTPVLRAQAGLIREGTLVRLAPAPVSR